MPLAVPAAAAAAQAPVPLPAAHPVADAQGAGPVVIGKVEKISGEAWVIHNGQKIPAKAGMGVAQGDSVETAQGAEISLVFADRTTFTLKDKGLVGLDEFSYDPVTKTGKESFLVAQGGFSFVSGDIAKTTPDAARIATPVMTMGIRGTTVAGSVGAGGETSVALLPDPGSNFVGEVSIGKTGGGGDVVTINSAGSGIVGATTTSTFTVSANAAAAVAAAAPAPTPPPATPPALPAAPAAAPAPAGPTGAAAGTGAAPAAAAAQGAQTAQTATTAASDAAQAPPPPPLPPAPEPAKVVAPEPPPPAPEPPPPPPPPPISSVNPLPPQPVNHAPDVTGSVSLTAGTQNVAQTFSLQSLMTNATDRDGDVLNVVGLTATHATATVSNGTVVVTPDANYTGTVTLSYLVADGKAFTADSATIDFQAPPNTAPTASLVLNSQSTDHASTSAGNFSASDADANDAGLLTYHLQGGTAYDATHEQVTTTGGYGTVILDTTAGTFIFNPGVSAASVGQGSIITDTFTALVVDGHGGTTSVGGAVSINGTNDAPTNSGAVAASAVTSGTVSTISIASLVANASDVDTGDSLTITAITATNGTATISGTDILYDPNGYSGAESFTYTISDSLGATVAGSATLTVNPGAVMTQTGTVLQSTAAQTLTDADFSAFSGATLLSMYSGAGTQAVTLSTNAAITGITKVDASTATGDVTINASALSSALTLTGGSGNDVLYGGSGADSLVGGLGNDTIHGASSDSLMDGGGGTADVLSVDAVNFEDGLGANGQITNIEIINLTNATTAGQWFKFDDQTDGFTINVTSSQYITLQGSQGNDVITGGASGEHLWGFYGNDTIAGGAGNNIIDGDTGTDIATYVDRSAAVTLSNAASAVSVTHDTTNTDTISNIEVIKGSDYADSFTTDASGSLTLDGGLGSDTYTLNTNALAAADVISDSGGTGTDTLALGASGTFDLSTGTIIGMEVLSTYLVGNTVILGGGTDPQQFKTIAGGAGTDVVKLYNSGTSLDLTGVTLSSIASIDTGTGSDSVSFDDISNGGVTMVVDGDASSGDSDTATFYLQTGGGTLDISGVVTSNIEHVVLQAAADTVENAAYTGLNLTMIGNNSGNTIIGGDGNDILTGGSGADLIKGGDGNNTIAAGGGQDTVSYSDRASGITATLSSSSITVSHDTAKSDTITAAEVLEGTASADIFQSSGAASATIKGGGGSDNFVLTGNPSANLTLEASGGSSALSMSISGRSAQSIVRDIEWSGSDILMTMAGGGTLTVTANSVDTIASSDGTNTVIVAAGGATGSDNYMVVGAAADTTLAGSTGDDMLIWHTGSIATLDGGTGNDTADFGDTALDMVVNLSSQNGTAVLGGTTTVTLTSIDHIQTGSNNDTITAGPGSTWIQAGEGNNQLSGYSGDAIVSYQDHLQSVIIDLGAGTATHSSGAGTDTLSGIDAVMGSDFNDTIYGSFGADTIYSSAGDDTLHGYSAANTLDFSRDPSGVVVDLTTGTATDGYGGFDTLNQMNNIIGSKYADTMTGSAGSDTFSGGLGADTLIAGSGTTTMTGGGGADDFRFTATGGVASVTDYTAGTDSLTLKNSEFSLGSSGTLAAASYAETTTGAFGAAQNLGTGAGIVAVQNGTDVELWKTTDLANASTANSHQFATLSNVNTSALDQTNFNLAV